MSHFAAEYPTELPMNAVMEFTRIARGGFTKISEERKLFGEAGWNVQGFLQSVTLGESHPLIGAEADEATETPTDNQAMLALESMASVDPNLKAFSFPLPPKALLKWLVTFMSEQILRLIEERLSA